MTIQEMIQKKKELGYSNQQIADMSGVPLGTVQKLFSGITMTPRYNTLQALSKVFEDRKEEILYLHDSGAESNMVHESSAAYKVSYVDSNDDRCRERRELIEKQLADEKLELEKIINKQIAERVPGTIGNKTIEDYMVLPEGTRIEMIDGRFYNMAAPTFAHQKIAGLIYNVFENFVKENGGPCMPSIAPTDVQLDCDDKTMVQPDVLVVCDRDKIIKARVVGAPDLLVEVLSPSNWYMDCFIKLKKYRNAGVREYWIVITDQKNILVYNFEKSTEPTEYTFEDKVPVAIWQDKCKVDFKEIYDNISFLLD